MALSNYRSESLQVMNRTALSILITAAMMMNAGITAVQAQTGNRAGTRPIYAKDGKHIIKRAETSLYGVALLTPGQKLLDMFGYPTEMRQYGGGLDDRAESIARTLAQMEGMGLGRNLAGASAGSTLTGQPDAVTDNTPLMLFEYPFASFYLDNMGLVVRIQSKMNGPRKAATARGITIGSPMQTVVDRYGWPAQIIGNGTLFMMDYWQQNVRFVLSRNVVMHIEVLNKFVHTRATPKPEPTPERSLVGVRLGARARDLINIMGTPTALFVPGSGGGSAVPTAGGAAGGSSIPMMGGAGMTMPPMGGGAAGAPMPMMGGAGMTMPPMGGGAAGVPMPMMGGAGMTMPPMGGGATGMPMPMMGGGGTMPGMPAMGGPASTGTGATSGPGGQSTVGSLGMALGEEVGAAYHDDQIEMSYFDRVHQVLYLFAVDNMEPTDANSNIWGRVTEVTAIGYQDKLGQKNRTPARTSRGIVLGSSFKDVINKYGWPTNLALADGKPLNAVYPSAHLAFQFIDYKVVSITVSADRPSPNAGLSMAASGGAGASAGPSASPMMGAGMTMPPMMGGAGMTMPPMGGMPAPMMGGGGGRRSGGPGSTMRPGVSLD